MYKGSPGKQDVSSLVKSDRLYRAYYARVIAQLAVIAKLCRKCP
jgi:hypothetical protein